MIIPSTFFFLFCFLHETEAAIKMEQHCFFFTQRDYCWASTSGNQAEMEFEEGGGINVDFNRNLNVFKS